MHKILIAAAATAGFLVMGTMAVSAAPVHGVVQASPAENRSILQADWYCGPRCQYWRHRRWEERERWREYHYGYSGYGYRPYNGGYSYYYR